MTSSSQPVSAVLFDLDGTLVDSSQDITASANAALATLGLGPFPMEEVMPSVGNGAASLLSRLAGFERKDDPRIEPLVQTFITHYRQHGAAASRLYPGVSRLLASLEGHARLAVVSNKPEALVWATLDHLRIDRFFDIVVGGDTLPRKKPDPMPIEWTLKRLRVAPDEAVMVGDSAIDMEAGRRAKVWTCGVTWGFGDPTALVESAPHALIDRPALLAQAFPPRASAG